MKEATTTEMVQGGDGGSVGRPGVADPRENRPLVLLIPWTVLGVVGESFPL
jgi:hypothetical protein